MRKRIFTLATCAALGALLLTDSASFAQRGWGGGGRGGGGRGGGGGGRGWSGRGYGGGYYGRGYYGRGNYGRGYRYGAYRPYYGSGYYATDEASAARKRARVTVHAPSDAEVWVGSRKATSEGEDITFRTKPLLVNKTYRYKVRARWTTEDGDEVNRAKTVILRGGKRVSVDFDAEDEGS